MFFSKRVTALSVLSAAALIGSSALGALPASAAGTILCSGDVCIQTISVNAAGTSAVITAWADTTTFTGHFELMSLTGQVQNGADKTWIAGGSTGSVRAKFTAALTEQNGHTFSMYGWKKVAAGSYTNVGIVKQFTVND